MSKSRNLVEGLTSSPGILTVIDDGDGYGEVQLDDGAQKHRIESVEELERLMDQLGYSTVGWSDSMEHPEEITQDPNTLQLAREIMTHLGYYVAP